MTGGPERPIAVIGRGPAASVAALTLAGKGARVVQFTGEPERTLRPPEVLGPRVRLLLKRLDLDAAADLGVSCSGVLHAWGSSEPDFTDYRLFALLEARAVARSELQATLLRAAAEAGTVQIAEPAYVRGLTPAGDPLVVWPGCDGRWRRLESRWTLLATGRSASLGALPLGIRSRLDRLVALAVPWRRQAHGDALALEAVEEGWWYAPPVSEAGSYFVLVTDADLLPEGEADRRAWLAAAFRRAPLARDLGSEPDFRSARGMDAHSAACDDPVMGRVALIGDAAICFDPLSGMGVEHALEGARVSAGELAEAGSIGPAYRAWFQDHKATQLAAGRESYRQAGRRLSHAPFWHRRAGASASGRFDSDG